jgi:hypothetical protein
VHGSGVELRALTVTGSVQLTGAAPVAVLLDVFGSMAVSGDDAILAGNLVFGDLDVQGGRALLVDDGIQGLFTLGGASPECQGNYAFADNGDRVVADDEVTAAYACP